MPTHVPLEDERLARIFYPYSREQYARAASRGTRFVHYTKAAVAMRILQTKEMWMRKSSCMNDYLEVRYGIDRLYNTYNNTATGNSFKAALNQIFPGITSDIEKLFNGWIPHFQTNTYFTCVSEHRDEEDAFGRLSMWRAYGQSTGVALVLNNAILLAPAPGLNIYSSPVAYMNNEDFEREVGRIVENINGEAEFVRSRGREEITNRVFNTLRYAAVCTKHPGFIEELEWRVIYCPTLEESSYLNQRDTSDQWSVATDLQNPSQGHS